MACSGNCSDTSPNGCICKPGRKGDPGPANTITIGVDTLPAGSTPEVVTTGVSPNQHFQIGFPLSPLPEISATAETGAIGVTVGGTTEAPIFAFTIPSGTNGTNGASRFTALTASFVQPALSGTVTITVTSTAWMSLGDWIYIAGGGWYIVASNALSATQIIIRNPGTAELSPLWGTPPSTAPWTNTWFIPFNASVGATITPSGAANQVAESGIPGTRGAQGAAGITPTISIDDAPPALPPTGPEDAFVFVANAVAPNAATVFTPYTYNFNTLAWEAGPNIAGPPGSQTYFQSADPNVVPIPDSNIGDSNWSVNPGGMILYRKSTVSAWSVVGTIPYGTATDTVVHDTPGTQTLDLSFGDFYVTIDKAIELDWDDASYSGQGNWTITISNADGSSQNLTFASGRWEEDPSLSIPGTTAIPSGDVLIIKFVKNNASGLMAITNFFTPSALGGS